MGLLDELFASAQSGFGLLAPNALDVEMRPKLAKGLLGVLPGSGDAISGYDAIQSARQGNYGDAALNGIGLLPFIPAMGGVIQADDIKKLLRLSGDTVRVPSHVYGTSAKYGDVVSAALKQAKAQQHYSGDRIANTEDFLSALENAVASKNKIESANTAARVAQANRASIQPSEAASQSFAAGRQYLQVPFAQKDRARSLGAKWDAAAKKWYWPNEAQMPSQFESYGWIPQGKMTGFSD